MNVLLYFSNSRNRRAVGVFTSLWCKGDGGERWWFPVDLLEKRVEGEDNVLLVRASLPPLWPHLRHGLLAPCDQLHWSHTRFLPASGLCTCLPSAWNSFPPHFLTQLLPVHPEAPRSNVTSSRKISKWVKPPNNGFQSSMYLFWMALVPTVISHPFWWLSDYSAFPSHADCEPPNGRGLSAVFICLSCT